MDTKAEKIYNTIENFLEERKGQDRRQQEVEEEKLADEDRRNSDGRRASDQSGARAS